jgi:hypothetical protein
MDAVDNAAMEVVLNVCHGCAANVKKKEELMVFFGFLLFYYYLFCPGGALPAGLTLVVVVS